MVGLVEKYDLSGSLDDLHGIRLLRCAGNAGRKAVLSQIAAIIHADVIFFRTGLERDLSSRTDIKSSYVNSREVGLAIRCYGNGLIDGLCDGRIIRRDGSGASNGNG